MTEDPSRRCRTVGAGLIVCLRSSVNRLLVLAMVCGVVFAGPSGVVIVDAQMTSPPSEEKSRHAVALPGPSVRLKYRELRRRTGAS